MEIVTGRPNFAPGRPSFDVLAVALILVAYTLTIWMALDLSFGAALVGGAANTVPVIVLGSLARRIIIARLAGKSLIIQIAGHAALCAAFTLLSFWLLIVLLGLVNGISPIEFTVRPFPLKGIAWQSLENVTTYGVIAALSYLQVHIPSSARAGPTTMPPSDLDLETEADQGRPRHFIRSGEDILPIDLDQVLSIAGADDYAEVTTMEGKHLVRMTLADFEQTLDKARFIRAHRSWIVNMDFIDRAEPAGGGRMLLHMKNGETISTSRAGSRLLRDRVI